jgi:hypothetical protein
MPMPPTKGPTMRVILELQPATGDRIAGTLVTERAGAPVPFDGWLELMQLHEAIQSNPAG